MYKALPNQSVETLLDWYDQTKKSVDAELLLARNMHFSALKLDGFNNFSVLDCLNLRPQALTKKEPNENKIAMQVVMDNVGHYDEFQMKTIWSIFFAEPFVPKPSKKVRGKSSIVDRGTIKISPLDQAKSQLKKEISRLGVVRSVQMVREFQRMVEEAVDVIKNKQKALFAARNVLYNEFLRHPIALSTQR